jgi:hypothetical protein
VLDTIFPILSTTTSPTLLQPLDGAIGLEDPSGGDVGQTTPGIVDEQQVDALAFQSVVVVQPVDIDQDDVTHWRDHQNPDKC